SDRTVRTALGRCFDALSRSEEASAWFDSTHATQVVEIRVDRHELVEAELAASTAHFGEALARAWDRVRPTRADSCLLAEGLSYWQDRLLHAPRQSKLRGGDLLRARHRSAAVILACLTIPDMTGGRPRLRGGSQSRVALGPVTAASMTPQELVRASEAEMTQGIKEGSSCVDKALAWAEHEVGIPPATRARLWMIGAAVGRLYGSPSMKLFHRAEATLDSHDPLIIDVAVNKSLVVAHVLGRPSLAIEFVQRALHSDVADLRCSMA